MRPTSAWLWGMTAITIAGCSSHQPPPPADPISLAHLEPVPPPPYLLQPGDVIAVKFYLAPQLNEDNLIVRPDGAISLPYIGNIVVAGRSAADVEAELRERYRPELVAPADGESVVTVIVRTLGSTQVHVGGEVVKDDRVPLLGRLTALEAIQRVGGFLETADPKRVVIIRQDPGGHRAAFLLDLTPVKRSGADHCG